MKQVKLYLTVFAIALAFVLWAASAWGDAPPESDFRFASVGAENGMTVVFRVGPGDEIDRVALYDGDALVADGFLDGFDDIQETWRRDLGSRQEPPRERPDRGDWRRNSRPEPPESPEATAQTPPSEEECPEGDYPRGHECHKSDEGDRTDEGELPPRKSCGDLDPAVIDRLRTYKRQNPDFQWTNPCPSQGGADA